MLADLLENAWYLITKLYCRQGSPVISPIYNGLSDRDAQLINDT
jgi:hypothetical protein